LTTRGRASIRVGILVERRRAESPWLDYLWRPVSALVGEPAAAPWTQVHADGDATLFYGGMATIELYRTETGNYRDNLASGAPALWVILRPTEADPPYTVLAVTADPAEGEGATEAGNDLVETVPMPEAVRDQVAAFIAAHHVERPFLKRRRDQAAPEVLRADKGRGDDKE
jgi:hypothetical protein